MGVKGLWSIVSPAGIRVNPEILTGKRIAIDVSIWLYELTYANNLKVLKNNSFDNLSIFNDLWLDFSQNINNEIRTDNLKKAHLYFFFLRICKLLYYNIRPIFIFDGNPPDLKKKTIFQRNLKKRNHEEKFRKIAEKLIYNYYQRNILKSLKNKKSISKKKKDKEKNILHNKKVSNTLKNNSLKNCGIIDHDNSLNNIVEKVGNVTVSMKDILNFCSDDLFRIESKILMMPYSNTITHENNKNDELNKNELKNDEKKKKYMINDKDKDEGENESVDSCKENSIIKKNKINNIDNDINEEIVRKKYIAKKKYYESIPKNFKGFLSMRRPVDIIDINSYNTDILEYTEKLKQAEEKYNKMYTEDTLLRSDFNSSNNSNLVSKDEKENYMYGSKVNNSYDNNLKKSNSLDIEYLASSNDDFLLLESKKNSTCKIDDKGNESDITYGVDLNKKDINILELPSNINSSNIFLDGKDEYKVYYVNNEEIKIPLFKEINKDVFEKLPIKLQYQILQDIKEEWYADNRIKAIKAKDDMDIFSQVQLETYVRMIKTDFEIEKLKIKMAENIQNTEGELIINKELSKNMENLNVRDYNDIKKKKKRRKKYLNEILNNCYFNNNDSPYDLMIKNEEKEKEEEKNDKIKDYNNDDIEAYENIEIKNNKIINIHKIEEEKKIMIKEENNFKKDLLMDDKLIFGDSFFVLEDENKNKEINNIKYLDKLNDKNKEQIDYITIESSDEYKINKRDNASYWEKNISLKRTANSNTKYKINYESDEIKNKLEKMQQKENEKNNFSSSDDFENCSIEEKNFNEILSMNKDAKMDLINNVGSFKECNKNRDGNLRKFPINDSLTNINTDFYTNDKIFTKTSKLERIFNIKEEDLINIKNFKTNDTFSYEHKINNNINFIKKKNESKENSSCELNRDTKIKEPLRNEILFDNITYLKENKDTGGDEDAFFSVDEDINVLNDKDNDLLNDKNINVLNDEDTDILNNKGNKMLNDKDINVLNDKDINVLSDKDNDILNNKGNNMLNDKDVNVLSDKDNDILNNKDNKMLNDKDINVLNDKDISVLSEKDNDILNNKGNNMLNDKDVNVLSDKDNDILNNKDINVLSDKDNDILNNKDNNMLNDKDENIQSDEIEDILSYKNENKLNDKGANILTDEDEDILNDKDENILSDEVEHISNDKHQSNVNEIKKKGNINKFISKQHITNILLNKCDLNNIGKENFFEHLLNNKEIMDKFSAQIKEKEKQKEDKNDEHAYYEDLEDNKIIDSYINEANKENEELTKEYKKLKKNNIEINDEMNDDVKILLDFFGIPYIQSPCEAEAQCAYLNNQNYCDAIISDDSDVLVFNGKTVIKNFFNRRKTVEVYERKIIEDKLGLYQEELINISLLCGCDYTTGVHGIGIVNSLEIIKAFPTFDDLKKLKDIVSNPFKEINNENYSEEIKNFLNTHKNYKLNWIFPNNFPDREVYRCFKYPKVSTNIKKFQWYFPNINNISDFLNKTTNIPKEKIFNVLNPILQKYDIKVRSYQLKIEDFFPIIERKRKNINDLIDKVRKNKKNKKKSNGNMELDKNTSSLIDVNPAGIIKSKRMTLALDYIKKRKSKKKK
ncbi:DNA repair protein RAD2, putative [Plasmodium relictum]|uniref:DNA repair protein RAD2, putative n=1 Tax=Plasmodium relictum TaxID=85471 RepID=A0A1J1H5D7_PLARL|nr:DNA repair protein RAD2, putative [Plasmodium relictum]CRG98809.1 DNA repair protein RAD2, putative [Plasmodium relictum]